MTLPNYQIDPHTHTLGALPLVYDSIWALFRLARAPVLRLILGFLIISLARSNLKTNYNVVGCQLQSNCTDKPNFQCRFQINMHLVTFERYATSKPSVNTNVTSSCRELVCSSSVRSTSDATSEYYVRGNPTTWRVKRAWESYHLDLVTAF